MVSHIVERLGPSLPPGSCLTMSSMDLSILRMLSLHQMPVKLALFKVLGTSSTSKYLKSVREEVIQWMFEVCAIPS